MPLKETLILAITKMHGGVCVAGVTAEPDPVSGLRWVRPIRERSHVLLGDITTLDGRVLQPFDVVELNLLRPVAMPPHTEDWITDFVRHRPRILRCLQDERRSSFLREHLDARPEEVLISRRRSLCLIKPQWIKGNFRLDAHSGKFDARLAFGLGRRRFTGTHAQGGLSVTDLKWRALGRAWLPEDGGWTEFDCGDLEVRFGIQEIYLVAGLTRSYRGDLWTIVVGVHTVPDYEVVIDYDNQ